MVTLGTPRDRDIAVNDKDLSSTYASQVDFVIHGRVFPGQCHVQVFERCRAASGARPLRGTARTAVDGLVDVP